MACHIVKRFWLWIHETPRPSMTESLNVCTCLRFPVGWGILTLSPVNQSDTTQLWAGLIWHLSPLTFCSWDTFPYVNFDPADPIECLVSFVDSIRSIVLICPIRVNGLKWPVSRHSFFFGSLTFVLYVLSSRSAVAVCVCMCAHVCACMHVSVCMLVWFELSILISVRLSYSTWQLNRFPLWNRGDYVSTMGWRIGTEPRGLFTLTFIYQHISERAVV